MKKIFFSLICMTVVIFTLPSAHAAALPSGDSVNGYLLPGSSHSHTFSGASGQAITLIMDESVSSHGQILLYKPDGSYWTYGNNLVHLTLPQNGTYIVQVKLSSASQQGNYTLHYLRGNNTVGNGTLLSGGTHYSTLNNYDMDSYTFSGISGQAITLIMDEAVSSHGQIYLYKPDGSYWTYGNNLVHLTLPESGIYTVVVRYSTLSQQGDYKLHYILSSDSVENGYLTSGTTQSDSLNAYDMDSYQFEGSTGEAITLIMDENISSHGQIYLYKPDGSYWTYGNNLTHVTLPSTGTYTVIIRYSTIAQQGSYKLHYVRGGNSVENGNITSGNSYSSVLNGYDMDSYTFTGLTGNTVLLKMNESVSSHGQIYVYKPNGSYWTYGNNQLNVTLPESGTYTVIVRYSTIYQQGSYSLDYWLTL